MMNSQIKKRMYRIRLILILGLVFFVAGCFRDASDEQENPTSIPMDSLPNATSTLRIDTDTTPIATLTETPQQDPTATFPLGGPPADGDEEDDEADVTPTPRLFFTPTPSEAESLNQGAGGGETNADTESDEQSDTNDLPPTRPIPSFTPQGSGAANSSASQFGDSGITPTADFSDPNVPDALITPDDLPGIEECVHIVQAGETLTRISSQYDVEVNAMVQANPALQGNINALQIGQFLNIPNCVPESFAEEQPDDAMDDDMDDEASDQTQAEPTSTTVALEAPEGTSIYVVQEGDSLFAIATQYGITVQEIVAANASLPTENTIIQPGQEIIIPTTE